MTHHSTFRAPAAWASYLVGGCRADQTDLTQTELAEIAQWMAFCGIDHVVDAEEIGLDEYRGVMTDLCAYTCVMRALP